MSASQSASWSMAVPRPTFTTKALSGSSAMRSRERMPAVSAVEGSAITRRSVSGKTLSNSAMAWMEVNAGSEGLTVRRTPVMHAGRKACARRANSVPMSPVPSTVMRAPCSERIPPGSVSQPPARMISVYSIWRRSSIRQTMMRCSEMVVP